MTYYKTKESVAEYIQMAKDVDSSQLISKFKNFIPTKSKILEIGSGPGTDWKMLNKDFEVIGSDFSEEFIKHLVANKPEGRFIQLNATTLETAETFDGIYSNKVLHHLNDQELADSIKRQSEILNEGGIICHSFWKGEGSEVFKGLFVNYHSESDLKEVFEAYFEVLLIEGYKEFEENDSLVLIGNKIT